MATKEKRYVVDQFVPVQELEATMNFRDEERHELIAQQWSDDTVTLVWDRAVKPRMIYPCAGE